MKKPTFLITSILLLSAILPQQGSSNEGIVSQTIDRKLRHDPEFKDYKIMLTEFSKKKNKPSPSAVLPKSDRCRSETLGIQFVCRPDWTVAEEKDGVLFIASSDGSAAMSVAKIDLPFRFLHQLDRAGMQKIGHYAEGFVVEELVFAGENAFKVKAFSDASPQSRFMDYYLMHDGAFYRISFSVNPKDRWDEHKFLIQDLSKGFSF